MGLPGAATSTKSPLVESGEMLSSGRVEATAMTPG